MKKIGCNSVIAAIALLLASANATPIYAQSAATATARNGSADFDFLLGTWRTHYRILRHRLVKNHDWYSCEGTSVVRAFWKGSGNLEDGDLHCPQFTTGGLTLRLYNPDTHQWSLWWGTRKLGVVPPQQVGHFDANGDGKFYAHDIQESKHVIIRFWWTQPNGLPHFEQAFSADNGKTWETNWTTDYERASPSTSGVWNATDVANDGHRGFDPLIGTWRMHYRRLRKPLSGDREWYTCEGTSVVRSFWGGAGNIEDGDVHCPAQDIAGVTLRVYDEATRKWQLWWGTKTLGLLKPPQVGVFDDHGVGAFYAHDTWKGKVVIVRYTWTLADPNHPLLEQAFSADRGKTWEINWTTLYDRIKA